MKGSGKRVIWMTIIAMSGWATWRWVKHGEAPFRRIGGTMTLGVFLLLLSELNDELAAGLALLAGLGVAISGAGATEQSTTQVIANPPISTNGRKTAPPGVQYIIT